MALPPTYKTRLKDKIILTEKTRDFIFEFIEPDTIEFEAGQFVLFKMNHPETGEFLSRAYSICSPPEQNHDVVFNIEIVERGKMTPLLDALAAGDELEMQGPFGHFVMKSGEEKDLIFVGTGTGVAPLRSMIEDLLNKGDKRKMSLYFGLRHQEMIFYQDVLEKLAEEHENFDFTLSLSRPMDGWEGPVGRVTAILPEIELDAAKTDVYLCGGKPMIDDVKQIFIDKGLEASQIYFEQFFL